MQARAIALGAAAFAGVAAGVTLFGPGLTGAEAEPDPAVTESASSAQVTPRPGDDNAERNGEADDNDDAGTDDDDDDDSDSDDDEDDD